MHCLFQLRPALLCILSALFSTGPMYAQIPVQADCVIPALAGPSSETHVPLSGHIPAWATATADLGEIPDATPLRLSLAISRTPALQAAFDQLLTDQLNPASTRYHQWLTPDQIGAQFGATQHDLDALIAWLTATGFDVLGVTPSRMEIQVSAPAALVQTAFNVRLHTFQTAAGALRGTTAEPSLPASFAPIVSAINGLSETVYTPYVHHATYTVPQGSQIPATLQPNDTINTTSGVQHFLQPEDFNTIYDVDAIYNAGATGSSQKIMIIGGSRVSASDASTWEATAARTSYQPNYIIPTGFTDPSTTGDEAQGEATLDFERAYGTAKGATVDMIVALGLETTASTPMALISYAINTVNDPVLSISFGSCEALNPATLIKSYDTLFAQAAAQGITTLVSAGDAGAAGCDTHGAAAPAAQSLSINELCASGNVTCVGGTEFSDTTSPSTYWSGGNGSGGVSALGYIPEGIWNEPVSNGVYTVNAGGGGASTVITKPSWQTGTGVPSDGARDTPDISFSASTHDGYYSCLGYAGENCSTSFGIFSGTSASAPGMAGIVALLDQKSGSRQGNLNPVLYKIAASTPAAFHDATPTTSGVSGCSTATPSTCNNSTPGPASLTGGLAGYGLTTGYDLATGLGSLDAFQFVKAIVPGTATGITLTPPTSPIAMNDPSLQFSVTITGYNGTTAFQSSATTTLMEGTTVVGTFGTLTLSGTTYKSPVLTLSTLAVGTHVLTAVFSGDGNYAPATSAPFSLVVTTALLTPTVTLQSAGGGTPTNITTEQTIIYTAKVNTTSNTVPTGTLQLVSTPGGNIGAPITISGTSLVTFATPFSAVAGTYALTAKYSGDSAYFAASSAAQNVTVTAFATTTKLTGVPATTTSITAVPVSISVVAAATNTKFPSGPVQMMVDSTPLGAPIVATVMNGLPVWSGTIYVPSGSHQITAVYLADPIFASSTSNISAVASTATATTTTLTATPAAVNTSQTTSLVATITGLSAAVAPTSTVVFKDGSTVLATIPGSAITANKASFTAGPLALGPHTLTATFTGDSYYTTSSSAALSLTVTQAPTFTLTAAPATLTFAAGATTGNTSTVTFTSVGGFVSAIMPTCTVTFSSGTANLPPTCSFATATVTPAANATVTDILTLSTTAAKAIAGTQASLQPAASLPDRNQPGRYLGGLASAALLLLLIPGRGQTARRWRAISAIMLLAAGLIAASGCGGASSSGGSSGGTTTTPTPTPGTSSGTYTVQITGTSGSTVVTGSISLTIQ